MERRLACRARSARRFALAAVIGGVAAACSGTGSTAPTAPTAPLPTPGPSPTPTTVSFLHVRQADAVVSYWIDDHSGRLELTARQDLGDIHQLVGDPRGRFVYAGCGRNGTNDPSIAAYASEAGGSLTPLSEAASHPEPGSWPWSSNRWKWLAASSSRVYALWTERRGGGGQHNSDAYVSHAVSESGQLGPAYVHQFLWDDEGHVTLDAGADVFYKAAPPEWVDSTDREGLTAHAVEPDGRLTQRGWSDLCDGTQARDVRPLVALRGVVFGNAYVPWPRTKVCSWESPRLAPRTSLGDVGSVAAGFSPADSTSPALLAFAQAIHRPAPSYAFVRTDLRLLSMATGHDPALLDRVEFPANVGQLLFHPSGRFLYVSGRDGSLRTYGIGPQNGLELIEDLPDAGGAGPDSGFIDAVLSMAVSVRPGTPRL
jgi:hypothetical protein